MTPAQTGLLVFGLLAAPWGFLLAITEPTPYTGCAVLAASAVALLGGAYLRNLP